MKEQIIEFIRERGGSVSFADFAGHFGAAFEGEVAMCKTDNENVILWANMSEAFVGALLSLLSEKVIKTTPTDPLVYIIDGLALTLPVVRGRYKYKTPHWLPVVFSLVETPDGTPLPF